MMVRTYLTAFILWLMLTAPAPVRGDNDLAAGSPGTRHHKVYLKNTDYELHVYRIFGRQPGKTLLIIGGIHGNEPGGYLAASHYVDLSLKRGNLIIVPRANLFSILKNQRGHAGDYNRKFANELNEEIADDKIISVLKELISEADCMLNLHDGSGFYRPTWIDDMHNPFRYGQSIIADCDIYNVPGSSHTLDLGSIANAVVRQVNQEITREQFQFRFANHDSISENTNYPDMRKTATFYALTEHHIPAFGVETSKSLPSTELKVEHQILVINAFMDEFGIQPDIPAKQIETPRFEYMVVAINDQQRNVVKKGETLSVEPGSLIRVDHIVGNYEDSMFADIAGYGGSNDNGLEVAVNQPVTISVRKDADHCGSITVVPEKRLAKRSDDTIEDEHFVLRVNGEISRVKPGERLQLLRGDSMTIVDFAADSDRTVTNVNLKGFVGMPGDNRGEDRGYTVDTANDLMADWSLNGRGERYLVVAMSRNRPDITMEIELVDPQISHALFQTATGIPLLVENGGEMVLDENSRIDLLSLVSKAGTIAAEQFRIQAGDELFDGPVLLSSDLHQQEITLLRAGSPLFTATVKFTGR